MTNLERLKLRTGDPDEVVLLDCLESAKSAILARRFPYQPWPTQEVEVVVPPVTGTDPETGDTIVVTPGRTETQMVTVLEPRYLDLQYRCAIDLYNRTGAEGQVSHSENGISRGWGAEWISQELLNEVVPMCGVVG